MITSLLASFTIALAAQGGGVKLSCPSTGEAIDEAAEVVYYNGSRYETCCGGCAAPFLKDPAGSLKSKALKGKTVGIFLFDPVSGKRLDAKKAEAGPSLFNGHAYYFESKDNQKAFDAEPKKFASMPTKEALFCPVMGHGIKSQPAAGGFVDHEGVRYYVCCGNCLAALKAEPAKYVPKAEKSVQSTKAVLQAG